MISKYSTLRAGAAVALPLIAFACSSSNDDTHSHGGVVVAAVEGAADAHCKNTDGTDIVVTVDPAACTATTEDAGEEHNHNPDAATEDSGVADEAGVDAGDTDASMSAYHLYPRHGDEDHTTTGETDPDVRFGTSASDDDCKYRVEWSSAAGSADHQTIFTVKVTNAADGTPVTGANPSAEVFLSDTHPAPNSGQTASETSPGVYTVGPVEFDETGRWTVRFHFFESCADSETSPHGHVAFYVTAP